MQATKISVLFLFLALLNIVACGVDDDGTDPMSGGLPILTADNQSINELDENTTMEFILNLDVAIDANVILSYSTLDGSAKAGSDYVAVANEEVRFLPNETSKTISIKILGDESFESEESFEILLFNSSNVTLSTTRIKATIIDDDSPTNNNVLEIPTTGYVAATSYPGKSLVWADEFEGTAINESDWTFEIGNGSGGWGNNELEYYRKENAFIQEGNLVIQAKKEAFSSFEYTSTRMKTQGKKSFKYGRIDIRAALPEGRGLWPALWMLGENITTVGWPACGEIDIMELVGNQASKVHGTLHYGESVAQHGFKGGSSSLSGGAKYIDEFHVFSIEWEEDRIQFYMDDQKYYEFTPSNTDGQPYPFNNDFFFIFNVAVGGDWPGSPEDDTVFPQFMVVDYIRVYQ